MTWNNQNIYQLAILEQAESAPNSHSIKGFYPDRACDGAGHHEHHIDVGQYLAINAVAALAIEWRGEAGDVRLSCSQDECCRGTKSAENFFSGQSALPDT